jgi:hypothetical protein
MLDGDLTSKVKYKKIEKTRIQVGLWKGYRTWCVLDDEMTDVLHAKLAYEVLVFLTREQLSKAVGRHLSSRLPIAFCERGVSAFSSYVVEGDYRDRFE